MKRPAETGSVHAERSDGPFTCGHDIEVAAEKQTNCGTDQGCRSEQEQVLPRCGSQGGHEPENDDGHLLVGGAATNADSRKYMDMVAQEQDIEECEE